MLHLPKSIIELNLFLLFNRAISKKNQSLSSRKSVQRITFLSLVDQTVLINNFIASYGANTSINYFDKSMISNRIINFIVPEVPKEPDSHHSKEQHLRMPGVRKNSPGESQTWKWWISHFYQQLQSGVHGQCSARKRTRRKWLEELELTYFHQCPAWREQSGLPELRFRTIPALFKVQQRLRNTKAFQSHSHWDKARS